MGSRSVVTSFFVQSNDDAIKVAVDGLRFQDTTVLQGFAGGAINVGSYGAMREAGIRGSSVTNTWIHRSLQYGDPAGRGGPGTDGGDCAGRRQMGRRATKARKGTEEVGRSCSAAAVETYMLC